VTGARSCRSAWRDAARGSTGANLSQRSAARGLEGANLSQRHAARGSTEANLSQRSAARGLDGATSRRGALHEVWRGQTSRGAPFAQLSGCGGRYAERGPKDQKVRRGGSGIVIGALIEVPQILRIFLIFCDPAEVLTAMGTGGEVSTWPSAPAPHRASAHPTQ